MSVKGAKLHGDNRNENISEENFMFIHLFKKVETFALLNNLPFEIFNLILDLLLDNSGLSFLA